MASENTLDMEMLAVKYDSEAYRETVELRDRILRKPLGLVFTPEDLAKEVDDFHLVGYVDGKLRCCLVLSPQNDDEIKMRQVAVDEHIQKNGLGTALVLFSEEFAKEKGYKTMVVNVRELAVDFYLKMDYTIIDEPFIEVGIPHRRFIKEL